MKLLKARVDQFPAVEQELVHVRNRLDREVRRFHDINLYIERLFKQTDPQFVLKITAEGLVDIFDLEVSGILQLDADGETLNPLAYIGPDRPAETLRLNPIWKKLQTQQTPRQTPTATVGPFLIDAPGLPQELADVIACPSYGADGEVNMIFWAGVTHESASVYDRLGADRVSSFAIYCHQSMNMLSQIQNQVQLESALLAKTKFLRNMSHVLRTPLNAIIGFTHIAMGDHPKPSIRSSLDMIRSSSKTLLQQISHILDFTQLESHQLKIECAPFSIEEMIQPIRHMLELETQKRELTLHFDIDRNIPELLIGDSLRLRHILINLVNNALEFTQEGGVSVSVHCTDKNDARCALEFSVQDTGIGMTDEQADSVFDSFSQADSSSTRQHTGLGLGLSLCQQIVALMGGTLHVSSQVGEGTTFSFTISLDRPADAGMQTPDDPMPAKKHATDAMFSLKDKRVLVVEDNLINQTLVESILSRSGIDVTLANDGQEALDALHKNNMFHAVLMDCQMPYMDGYQATELIRKNPRFEELPVIALTAHALEGDNDKSIKAGMDDHLTKPIDPTLILECLTKWIQTGRSPSA